MSIKTIQVCQSCGLPMSGEYMFTETGTRVQNIAGIAFKKDFSQQLRLMNSRKPLPPPDEKDMPTSVT